MPPPRDCAGLRGKLAVVTGGTRGIGLAVAGGFVARGLRVVITGSSAGSGVQALRELRALGGAEPVHFLPADFSRPQELRALAVAIRALGVPLHCLVHNAALVSPARRHTAEGIELQLMVNHLAPYLLTHELMDALRGAGQARVVVTASQVEQGAALDPGNLQSDGDYQGHRVYAMTKLANLLFSYALARRLPPDVTVNALHPGVVRTRLLEALGDCDNPRDAGGALAAARALAGRTLRRLRILPPVRDWALDTTAGAQTTLAVALDAALDGVSGRYFAGMEARASSPASHDRDLQEQLWTASARLLGIDPQWPP